MLWCSLNAVWQGLPGGRVWAVSPHLVGWLSPETQGRKKKSIHTHAGMGGGYYLIACHKMINYHHCVMAVLSLTSNYSLAAIISTSTVCRFEKVLSSAIADGSYVCCVSVETMTTFWLWAKRKTRAKDRLTKNWTASPSRGAFLLVYLLCTVWN